MENYADYKNLILKLSWSWSMTSNLSQEDLFSEGNLIFVKCQENFDDEKAKFSTFLYLCISRHFKQMVERQNKVEKNTTKSVDCNEDPDSENYICVSEENPEDRIASKDSYEKLSKEAKDVIDIVLNCPSEVFEMLSSPVLKVIQRRKVWHYLCQNLGKTRASKVSKELSRFVSEF